MDLTLKNEAVHLEHHPISVGISRRYKLSSGSEGFFVDDVNFIDIHHYVSEYSCVRRFVKGGPEVLARFVETIVLSYGVYLKSCLSYRKID